MTKIGAVKWTGASGKTYIFDVFDKLTSFKEIDGNYIFARLKGLSYWEAVYIGQGDLKARTQDKEHLQCASRNGFTHYHVLVESDVDLRKSIEEDLILNNPECLEENGGCNKSITG
ncbi:MAG: hypothetical protein EP346_07035 [Bacteroidetes bacterium]|nr:MAG: hypothetical protein EP346_07035 [Bacteroidota bacterium]